MLSSNSPHRFEYGIVMIMDTQDVYQDGINFRNPRALTYFLAGFAVWWVMAAIGLYLATDLTSVWSMMLGWFSTTFYALAAFWLSTRFEKEDGIGDETFDSTSSAW